LSCLCIPQLYFYKQAIEAQRKSAPLDPQRNASAAFSAAIENDDVFVQEAVQAGAAAQVVSLLDGCRDKGLILNLLNALGTLCEAGPEASASMTAAGGVEAVLPWCSAGQAAHLQLAAVDCLCKAAASSDEAKDVAAGKGAVAALAGLLGSGNAEVQVRSLLALGMLCGGGDNARQLQLATAPGAVDGLLVLMKQDADADCQQLAAALFTAMGKNPAVKDVLAAQTIQK
jgi:hypothetical protein